MSPSDLLAQARDTLRANDRGGYTIPSQGLYPFQWMWDAGFNALGWATFDEARAWLELETLLRGQWNDGMIPHIVFHQPSQSYFPGPEFWNAPGPVSSTGITQPAILATVAKRLLDRARDRALATAKLRGLYPRLLAYHRWLYRARDPEGTGLVAVLHPWEGGMDNSPIWDEALMRVEPVELPSARRDIGHVSADQRPSTEEYQRYISLVLAFRNRGYAPDTLYRESPFRIVSVAFNALLHRANLDLLELAETLSRPDAAEIGGWIERGQEAIAGLWDTEDGFFYPRDLVSGESIRVRTCDGFLPLFAGVASTEQAALLAETMDAWSRSVTYAFPSADPHSPVFEPRRYWRGPVWINMNWLLSKGLAGYGFSELADKLRRDSFELVERSGMSEYFDPHTGAGLGGKGFAWTAALLLDWSHRAPED